MMFFFLTCARTLACLNVAGVPSNKIILHYTAPYSTYSQAMYLNGQVCDLSPAAMQECSSKRNNLIDSWYEGKEIAAIPPEFADGAKGYAGSTKQYVAELIRSIDVAPTKCCVCDSEGRSWCGKCHAVKYCTRQCQAQDWKAGHKAACNLLYYV
jgi:MYND finger